MTDLPRGWIEAEIGDLCDLKNGRAFKPSEWTTSGRKIVRIQNLNNPDAPYNHFDGEVRERFIIQTDDLLFAWSGTPGTSFGAHIWRGEEAVLNQHIFRVDFDRNLLDLKFFKYAINETLDELIEKAHGGVGLRHVTKSKFEETRIPVPPLNEQRRIVDIIEARFDEMEKGIESLQAAKNSLNLYRQSLLQFAFDGRLTADWRAQNADKLEDPQNLHAGIQIEREARYTAAIDTWQMALTTWFTNGEKGKKPSKPKRPPDIKPQHVSENACPNFPNEWGSVRFGELNLIVSDGPFGSNLKTSDYTEKGVRVIRLENIGYGSFLEEKRSFISEEKYETIKQHSVYPGTIVVSSFVTDAMRSCIVPKSIPLAINKADCFAITLEGEQTSTNFAAYYLQSPQVFDQLKDLVHGVGRPRINTSQLKELHFPICSPVEQTEIVHILDIRRAAAEALEAEINAALTRTDALRQSILKKAFNGQLVPQNPADEPASLLVKRTRAETVRADRRHGKAAPPAKSNARRLKLNDLIEVLKKNRNWLSASKAAQELGISNGATSDEVEVFYRQLKEYVEGGIIDVERRGDEDWLRLAKAEVG